jgi:class 3 adenylate cyclase
MSDVEYAECDGVHVAYRVLDGPAEVELVMVSGFNFPFELLPDDPVGARLLDGLRAIGRLAVFDRRGVGLSDPIVDWERPLVDQWSDDLRAVIDAAGFDRPAIFAWDVFGVARRFAIRFPDACRALVLLTPAPSPARDGDEWHDAFWDHMRRVTAGEDDFLCVSFPTRWQDPAFRAWLDRAGRVGASPASAARMIEAIYEQLRAVPIEHHLVRVPTLVLARPRNVTRPHEVVQRVADAIDGAWLVELPGDDDLAIGADVDALVAEVARFLTGEAKVPPPSRTLRAVLFTDLVSSTERAAALGDERWKAVLDRHDEVACAIVGRCAGRVVKTTGDGILAVLPSASAGLRAADEIRRTLTRDGLAVRIGLHVAEVEARGDDVAGLGVHVAARIMSAAGPGEILVSATVPMIVGDGAATFVPRGRHTLKGVPGEWDLFAAAPEDQPLISPVEPAR